MGKKRKIAAIPILAVAFCFVLGSPAQAEEKIKSMKWLDHKPNPRFAIHDSGTPAEEGDDLVLDKETELVWARNGHLAGKQLTWEDATVYCKNLDLGNLKGWRLPTKEEVLSIVIPSKTYPPLPRGHPFVNFKYSYWTGTTHEDLSDDAYFIDHEGVMWGWSKMFQLGVWPVLGK